MAGLSAVVAGSLTAIVLLVGAVTRDVTDSAANIALYRLIGVGLIAYFLIRQIRRTVRAIASSVTLLSTNETLHLYDYTKREINTKMN